MGAGIVLLGLLACQTVLTGSVTSTAGGPVAGATLTSAGCDAVTGADGAFRVACTKGARTFTVRHPDYLEQSWDVAPDGLGDQAVGSVSLEPIPEATGLFLPEGGHLVPLPPGPLMRQATAEEQRWCMDAKGGAPTEVPAGPVRLLDNHGVDWRIYRLDADGCAWRMKPGGAEHWTWTADRVETHALEERGPGRTWVGMELPPGDYAIVEWYEGFFVHTPGEERWNGSWLRAVPGTNAVAEAVAPSTPTAGQAP